MQIVCQKRLNRDLNEVQVRMRVGEMKSKATIAERPSQRKHPRCNKGSRDADPKGTVTPSHGSPLSHAERGLRSAKTPWETRAETASNKQFRFATPPHSPSYRQKEGPHEAKNVK